jgi:hypothetical protein
MTQVADDLPCVDHRCNPGRADEQDCCLPAILSVLCWLHDPCQDVPQCNFRGAQAWGKSDSVS